MPSLVEIGPAVLREIFLNPVNVFRYLVKSPLEKGVALHLNKLESPLPRNDLCQVGLKLARWF